MSAPVAIVLAAGLGTRLRPSTEHCPKPLIPVGGVEPLFFALHKAYLIGSRVAIVNAHHLSGRIDESLKRFSSLLPGMTIHLSVENPILGTGGGLVKMLQAFPEEVAKSGVIVQNGDTLAEFDLRGLLGDQSQNRFGVSRRSEHLRKYNPLWVDDHGLWSGIGKQAPASTDTPAHFLGVYFLRPEAVQKLCNPKQFEVESNDLFNFVFRPLTKLGERFVSAEYMHDQASAKDDFWFDMTTAEYLLEAQRHVLGTLQTSRVWSKVLEARFPGIKEVEPGIWIGGSKSRPEVSLISPAVLVDQAKGKAKRISSLVLGPNASFIHERGPVVSSKEGDGFHISNAVVFTGNSSGAQLPKSLEGAIFVL